ncbi:MAG: aminotransferase class I/II-fold pyridoxal phosphate-dependent enzyme [Bdellovibrionota bacterium]
MKPRSVPKLILHESSPLSRLLGARQHGEEFTRARRFGHLLEPFHLKYSVTTEVNGRRCVVNGKNVLQFASSNYLGLEQHPEVLYAAKRAIDELGTETGCSRLTSSHGNLLELEAGISELLGTDSALVGHTTAQLHFETIPALFGEPGSVLYLDKHSSREMYHACAAATAKGARIVRVDVSDPPALARIVKRERAKRGALLVDGVYSVHGHSPDLELLDELCREAEIVLYVDDTHGVGVLGANGGGSVEASGLGLGNLVLVGSLQKAFGAYGAFVTGSAPLVELLRLASLDYCPAGTSLQPSAVEGALAAVRISRSSEGRRLRAQLAETSRKVRARLQSKGFVVPPGDSPIIPVSIGRDLKTLMAGRKLFDLGVLVSSVSFPEVPHGRGVLRISLTTLHSPEDLEALYEAFRELRHYLPKYENPLRQAAHVAFEAGKAKWYGSAYAGL